MIVTELVTVALVLLIHAKLIDFETKFLGVSGYVWLLQLVERAIATGCILLAVASIITAIEQAIYK